MKKLVIISVLSISAIAVVSCGDKRTPGLDYMPDMRHSRAYETYSEASHDPSKPFHYNSLPVAGTVNRGEELPYHLPNDSAGYAASYSITSPLPKLNDVELAEADRLYQINCAICHGSKLDGNGPLYNGGNGPYAAKPATLVGDPKIEALSEGTIFHVQTYGKNLMGSYAGQLNRKQRWMIAQYIKHKQGGGKTSAEPDQQGVAPEATPATATGSGSTGPNK